MQSILAGKASHIPRLALNISLADVFAWCDSTIVLHWLDGSPRRFKYFVGNRISSILDVLPPIKWRHVPTDSNPADCTPEVFYPRICSSINCGSMASTSCRLNLFSGLHSLSPLHSAHWSSRPLCATLLVRSLLSGLRRGMAIITS